MSGGDGKDSRGPGGGVNGGPTGLGGGGGASDHSGWSSENNPWGARIKTLVDIPGAAITVGTGILPTPGVTLT